VRDQKITGAAHLWGQYGVKVWGQMLGTATTGENSEEVSMT
jgi:hypothetical protein